MTQSEATRIQRAHLPGGYELKIIDAHHHFWDLEGRGHWPWLQEAYDEGFFLGDYHKMIRTFLPKEYLDETDGWPILATVHCQAERAQEDQVLEDLFVEDLNKATGGRFPAAAVAHVYFTQPDVDEVLAEHAKHPLVRGIRSKPRIAHGPGEEYGGPGTLRDPKWVEGLSKLQKYGFSWDLRVPYYHLSEAADVLRDFPDLPVVVNHCGLPLDRSESGLRIWRRGMHKLAELPEVCVKVSELGLNRNVWNRTSNEQVVRETLEIFGADRSMFASNLPVCTLTARSFNEVMDTILAGATFLDEKGLDELFHGTAARFYRLDLSALSASLDS